MTAPIDAVSGLVEELRARAASYRLGGPSSEHTALLLDRAADALEAQARELAETRRERDVADDAREAHAKCTTALIDTAQARITALEDAVRVKDEALRPFASSFAAAREAYGRRYGKDEAIGLANFDKMPDRWPMDHLRFDMGTFRRARTALAKGQNALVSGREDGE